MLIFSFVTLLMCCAAREFEDKLDDTLYEETDPWRKVNSGITTKFIDRYIIACHSTDFECFRRQFKSLRDHVLLGNQRLSVQPYEHYIFKYGESGTCIKLAGLELSELTGIHLDSASREFSWTLELPFKIQQVFNVSANCVKPENVQGDENSEVWLERMVDSHHLRVLLLHTPHIMRFRLSQHCGTSTTTDSTVLFFNGPDAQFTNVKPHRGPLKKFTGNATIQVTYPYTLRKRKGEVHMVLGDENLDVILDIPDLSHYNKESQFERNLYELSEWAYSVVQHIDAAQNFALPFTSHFRTVAEQLPLRRLLLLYPDEEYADLRFKFTENYSKCLEKLTV